MLLFVFVFVFVVVFVPRTGIVGGDTVLGGAKTVARDPRDNHAFGCCDGDGGMDIFITAQEFLLFIIIPRFRQYCLYFFKGKTQITKKKQPHIPKKRCLKCQKHILRVDGAHPIGCFYIP